MTKAPPPPVASSRSAVEDPCVTSVLLLSSSYTWGTGYLDHAEAEIRDVLTGVHEVLFVPWAMLHHVAYAAKARERFESMGFHLRSVHDVPEPVRAVAEAEAVFVGGGNTFRLLKALYESRVLEAVRERVASGMPYIGSSAGSIVAGPTIRTTKDMPIVQPPSFEALGLVGFQISPHFLDPDPVSRHMGETQEERISQFHEEADVPVAGLREGAMLRVTEASVVLKGGAGARLFRRGQPPIEARPVEEVGAILKAAGARP